MHFWLIYDISFSKLPWRPDERPIVGNTFAMYANNTILYIHYLSSSLNISSGKKNIYIGTYVYTYYVQSCWIHCCCWDDSLVRSFRPFATYPSFGNLGVPHFIFYNTTTRSPHKNRSGLRRKRRGDTRFLATKSCSKSWQISQLSYLGRAHLNYSRVDGEMSTHSKPRNSSELRSLYNTSELEGCGFVPLMARCSKSSKTWTMVGAERFPCRQWPVKATLCVRPARIALPLSKRSARRHISKEKQSTMC